MRVQGNTYPDSVEVMFYAPGWRKRDVRLRENIHAIETEDGTLYEYDEYRLVLPETGTLEHDIRENLEAWLVSARTREFNEMASEAIAREEQYTQDIAELVEIIYNGDLEVIG